MPTDESQMRRYEFKKALQELESLKGRGTELISLYVPPGKQISDVVQYLREEFSTSSNIKSVVTTTGQVVGKLDNLVLNLDTGEVTNLLVEPTEDAVIQTLERDKEGRYVVSIKGIKSMEDVLVVDLSQSKHI